MFKFLNIFKKNKKELKKELDPVEVEKLKELINKVKLNSIEVKLDENNKEEFRLGKSKIGGIPDLPTNFNCYYYEAESLFDGVIKSRPLSFLAQFNLEEISIYDTENRLPKKGILYFFYEIESMKWGFDPKDKGCARVFYYEGEIDKLVPTNPPKEISKDYILPEINIQFSTKYNAPDFSEIFDNPKNYIEGYSEMVEKLNYTPIKDYPTKLLGYSDNIQFDMTLECQLVTNGLFCGDATGYNSDRREELEKSKNQWKLLFQFASLETDDYMLMFGDSGLIYFYIKEEDLKNKNFENVWVILQCD